MSNNLITSYSFNPSARTVTLPGVPSINLRGLSIIVDVTVGAQLYLPGVVGLIPTAAGDVITLNASLASVLAGASSGDELLILYDNGIYNSPYQYTPLSPGQHGVTLATGGGTALTPPSGALFANVQANGGALKYTTDGTTSPTATVGTTIGPGGSLWLSGAAMIANFRAFSATATVDVEFYK